MSITKTQLLSSFFIVALLRSGLILADQDPPGAIVFNDGACITTIKEGTFIIDSACNHIDTPFQLSNVRSAATITFTLVVDSTHQDSATIRTIQRAVSSPPGAYLTVRQLFRYRPPVVIQPGIRLTEVNLFAGDPEVNKVRSIKIELNK